MVEQSNDKSDKDSNSKKVKAEKGARRKLINELFQDFNRSRVQVYKMNFVRGLFFGFGSVLGGTILVAISVGILSVLGQFIPYFSDFFKAVTEVLSQS